MLDISGYGVLSTKRLKFMLCKQLALSDCYLSLKFHVKGEQFSLTLVLAGKGSMQPPRNCFCDARRPMSRIVLKFCIAYEASCAQLLLKKMTGSYQVTEL